MPLKTSKEKDSRRAYLTAFRRVLSFRLRGEFFLGKLDSLSALLDWYRLHLLRDRTTRIEFVILRHNVTPVACFGYCVEGCSVTHSDGPLLIYVLRLHSLRELCLAQVIGDMRRSAE